MADVPPRPNAELLCRLTRGTWPLHRGLSRGQFARMLLDIKEMPKTSPAGLLLEAGRSSFSTWRQSDLLDRIGGVHAAFRREKMNALKMAGVVLIAAGILGLVFGSFSFTKETHEAKIGPIELSVKDKETVNVPVWAGVGAIVIGGALLVFGGKRG